MKGGKTPIHIMRWAPADFVNDPFVRLLVAEEDFATFALYTLVLNWSHMEGGDLTSDPRLLAATLGMRPRRVERALARCLDAGKLQVDDGRVFHKRVVREVAEELEYRELQSIRGRQGGRPKESGGKAGEKPVVSGRQSPPSPAPAPAPAPAPNAVRQRLAPDTDRPGNPGNPLVAGRRVDLERECLALVDELAKATGEDPIDVIARASGYAGAATTKLNPATMSDDRLANTVRDLRADVASERTKAQHKPQVVPRGA
jgi:hypothetical protein